MCVQQSNLRLKFPVLSNTDLRWNLEQLELSTNFSPTPDWATLGLEAEFCISGWRAGFPGPIPVPSAEFLQIWWSLHVSGFTGLKVFKFHPHSICFWELSHKRMVMSPFITLPAVYDPITFSTGLCLSWNNKSTWPALWHLLLIFMVFYKNQGRNLFVSSRGCGNWNGVEKLLPSSSQEHYSPCPAKSLSWSPYPLLRNRQMRSKHWSMFGCNPNLCRAKGKLHGPKEPVLALWPHCVDSSVNTACRFCSASITPRNKMSASFHQGWNKPPLRALSTWHLVGGGRGVGIITLERGKRTASQHSSLLSTSPDFSPYKVCEHGGGIQQVCLGLLLPWECGYRSHMVISPEMMSTFLLRFTLQGNMKSPTQCLFQPWISISLLQL